MDKEIREMQIAAGIIVAEDEAIEEETVEEETVDEEVIEETEEVDEEVVDEEEIVDEGTLPDALKKHQFGAKDDDDSDDDDSDDDDSDDDDSDDKEAVDEDIINWMKRFDRLDGPVNEEVVEEIVDEEEEVDEEVIEEAEEVDEEIVDEEEEVDEEVIEEDCPTDPEKNADGDCSPFTHGDENVDMVREDEGEKCINCRRGTMQRGETMMGPAKQCDRCNYQVQVDEAAFEEGDENPLGVDHACPECSGTGMGYGIEAGDCKACSGSGVNEASFEEDLLLAPKGDVGPGQDEPNAGYQATGDVRGGRDSYDDDDGNWDNSGNVSVRTEPELDRQTDFDAPSRNDGDDMHEEPSEDERIIDVGDDEDYETYDFDNEFEQMLGGSSDPIDGGMRGSMYEMNDLRRLAGLEQVVEEIIDEEEVEEEVVEEEAVDEADVVEEDQAAGAPITGELVAYDISDEKAYYVMADVIGNELDFGPEDEVLVPIARNDEVLVALDQQGFEKGVDFCVAGEQYEADLQNGYNDRSFSDGQDYFPKGATSQPATDLGPTASNQTDNPMSNKMRSIEKDDVYEGMKLAYRRHRKA